MGLLPFVSGSGDNFGVSRRPRRGREVSGFEVTREELKVSVHLLSGLICESSGLWCVNKAKQWRWDFKPFLWALTS